MRRHELHDGMAPLEDSIERNDERFHRQMSERQMLQHFMHQRITQRHVHSSKQPGLGKF